MATGEGVGVVDIAGPKRPGEAAVVSAGPTGIEYARTSGSVHSPASGKSAWQAYIDACPLKTDHDCLPR